MPYYLRAKTYLRYAEEAYKRALQNLSQNPRQAQAELKDAFSLAAKALWALAQVEAPQEKPPLEKILAELSHVAEPEIARFFQEGWKKWQSGLSLEEAQTLVSKGLAYAREVLAPLLGPSGWSRVR